ncbi:hypothetical protein [Methanobrevibacter sp.]|uniref:hypothetical protein n=1 Tax=Methanobrevibacter sp. TaxID=66852 RepID=UPI0025CB84B9|nr:hypothetical protein [Methanobrevibacter sp.]MBR4447648.1 hypothetical protein [Methanobrevibacter sp.]
MSDDGTFDWYGYYALAESYGNESDFAKLRTGINRLYYSSFLESRDYILENETFLNEINRHIMQSKSGRVHQETRLTFDSHPLLNQENNGKKIAQRLNVLRKYRNMVDYDSHNPKNLKRAYNRCKSKAKKNI